MDRKGLTLLLQPHVWGGLLGTILTAAVLATSGTAAARTGHACSNAGYLKSWRAANILFTAAASRINAGRFTMAAPYVQRARDRVQSAPLPCSSKLMKARTYTLKEYADTLQALRADVDGDVASAIVYLRRAQHEQDVVAALVGSH